MTLYSRLSKCPSRICLTLSGIALLTACETRSQDDALLGTAFGAAAGALVGHGRGEAIAIGAGLGAVTGGVIGQGADQKRKAPPPQVVAPLTLDQIVQLCRAGTPAYQVIQMLRVRGGIYTQIDIQVLNSYKEVPESVLDYLRSNLNLSAR